jgi:hypothetical protein
MNAERARPLGPHSPVSHAHRVTPSKIVVTTTISSEETGAPAPSLAPEALSTLSQTPSPLQKMANDGRILMVKIAPGTYLGLTDGRRRVSPLQIDDQLFIFAPREDALVHLAELVADLVRTLPEGTPAPQVQAKIEELAADYSRR